MTNAEKLMESASNSRIPSSLLSGHFGPISHVGILLRDGWAPHETSEPNVRTTIVTVGKIDRCIMEWESVPTERMSPWMDGGKNTDVIDVNVTNISKKETKEIRARHERKILSLELKNDVKELGISKETSSASVLRARGWTETVLFPGRQVAHDGVEREGRNEEKTESELKSLGTFNIERIYGFRTVGVRNSVRWMKDEREMRKDDEKGRKAGGGGAGSGSGVGRQTSPFLFRAEMNDGDNDGYNDGDKGESGHNLNSNSSSEKKRRIKRNKELLTFTGGMVVRREESGVNDGTKQKASLLHDSTITCIDLMKCWSRGPTAVEMDPSVFRGGGERMTLVATGDVASLPTIALWNADRMECISKTSGVHVKCIKCIQLFKSPVLRDQTLLGSVGGDYNQTMLVHTVPNLIVLHRIETGRRIVNELQWYPHPYDVRREAKENEAEREKGRRRRRRGEEKKRSEPLTTPTKSSSMSSSTSSGSVALDSKIDGTSYVTTTPCLIHVGAEHCVFRAIPTITVGQHQEVGHTSMDLDAPTTVHTCAVVCGHVLVVGTDGGKVLVYDARRIGQGGGDHSTRNKNLTMVGTRRKMIVEKNESAHRGERIHTIARVFERDGGIRSKQRMMVVTGGDQGHVHVFDVRTSVAGGGRGGRRGGGRGGGRGGREEEETFRCIHLFDLSIGFDLASSPSESTPSHQRIRSIDSSECDGVLLVATAEGRLYTHQLPNDMSGNVAPVRDRRTKKDKEDDELNRMADQERGGGGENGNGVVSMGKDEKESKSEIVGEMETVAQITTTITTTTKTQNNDYDQQWHLLMETHGGRTYEYQIRDFCPHPMHDSIFATVGDDKYLKMWNSNTGVCTRSIPLQNPGTCIQFSSRGDRMCIGLGPVPNDIDSGKLKSHLELAGAFQIMTSDDFVLRHTGRDTKARIHLARWSLDDTLLAIASEDRRIAVYNSSGNADGDHPSEYKLMYKLLGFEHPPTSLDFSIGNEFLRCSAAPSGEILYCRPGGVQKTKGGSIQPDILTEAHFIQVKDVQWGTHTCPYQWGATGLHPMEESTDDVTSVAVSERVRIMLAIDGNGVLTATRFPNPRHGRQAKTRTRMTGSLGTLGFPATNQTKQTDDYGRGSGIVKFLRSGERFLTLSPNESTIVQWSYKESSLHPDQHTEQEKIKYNKLGRRFEMSDRYHNIQNRPWISSLIYPSGYIKEKHQLTIPTVRKWSRLKRVIGFSTQHVLQSREGRLLYHSAALGISLDTNSNNQYFYYGHCPNEISGMGCGGGGRIVATGERVTKGASATIHVWCADTCTSLCVLPSFHRTAVTSLDVSENGEWILSVGHDACHTVALWRAEGVPHDGRSGSSKWSGMQGGDVSLFPHLPHWRETGRLVSYSETGTRPVTFCLLLNGRQRTVKASNEEYDAMTGGVGHVTLWYVRGEDLLPSKTVTTYDLRGLNADLSGIAWMTRERPPSSSSSSSSSSSGGTTEQKEGKKRGRRVRMQEDDGEEEEDDDDDDDDDLFHSGSPVGNVLCGCIVAGKEIVTGNSEGGLIMWHPMYGDPVGRREQAHKGEVWCVASAGEVIVSGGEDGYVRVWDLEMNCIGARNFPVKDMSTGTGIILKNFVI